MATAIPKLFTQKFTAKACLVASAIALSACSSTLKQPEEASDTAPNNIETTTVTVVEEPKIDDRPFAIETLYALLTAEIAGSRERYDIALKHYLQQAIHTRDPGIAARATHIARYLNVQQAVLQASNLWVEIEPDNLEARFILATTLGKDGQLNAALPHAIYLLQHNGTSTLQSLAAQAANSTDTQRESLIQSYETLLVDYPTNTQLLTGLGILHQQQNNLDTALDYVQQALAQEPNLISAAVLEARLLIATGKQEKALLRLQSMLEQYPDDNRVRIQYARILASIDLPAAQEQFQLLYDQEPNNPNVIFSLALITRELDEPAAAQELFEALIPFPERRSSAHFYLGKINEASGNDEIALNHYMQVEPGSDFTAALLHSTDILVRQDNIANARRNLANVRQQFPEQAERLYLLEAEVLSNNQQHQEALTTLATGLTQHPQSIALLYSRAMTNELLGDLDGLEADLKTVLLYDPNNATALNALGYTLADRNIRLEEALALITKALQIKPNDPAVIDSMGWVQYRLGNFEAALLRLRQAMQAMPDHEIAAHLGEVLWVSGSQQEAQKIWQQGLELYPESQIIKDTKQRLIDPDSQ